ncbi:MAG: prepilin-type N-terminal cleavage/methylation domain-containing protein, partial [Rhodoferax sp.]|nr:prepilin-type N-terminal cleavage/methylation domain-containing protein [Rhodoferax sp.]
MLIVQRQRGMTLVEVMIAMGVGLFLLLGLTTFLTANLASNAANLQQNLLNSELRAVMTLMARDIR